MAIKLFRTRRNLEELKARFESLQTKTRLLEAEIYRLKHPNGEIYYRVHPIFLYNEVCFRYAYRDKISEYTTIYITNNTNKKLIAYKTVIKEPYAYIGLKFESENTGSEHYYIVDMSDGKVIECTNQDALNTVDWVLAD